jgi:hypothetical protein
MGQPLLFSREVADHAPVELKSLGARKLRNVAEEQEIFAVSGTDFG